MKTTTALAALTILALGVGTPAAATPPNPAPSKGDAVDTSFLKQYAETRGFMLGRPQKPKVTPDGKAVLFLRTDGKSPKLRLYEFDVATGQTKELLSAESLLKGAEESLTPEEKARRERQRVTAGGFADYHLNPAGTHVLVKLSNTLYVLERATGKVRELKAGTDGSVVDPKWSPDGKLVGYVRGFDVYAYDLAADKELPVTTGGTQVKTHGLAEFVAQEEMGRFSGYWWSPDAKFIAYEEADHTGVEQWYVADPFKPDVPPSPQYYPRPGKKNVAVRLSIKPVAGGEPAWVDWDRKKYEYLAKVVWEKYGPLTVLLQDRSQATIDVFDANPTTGQARRLFRMRSPHWINLNHVALHWAKDGSLALARQPDVELGFGEGDAQPRVNDISAGFVDEPALVQFDPDTGGGLLQATWLPYRMHAFRMKPGDRAKSLRLDEVTRLTTLDGVHTVAGTDKLPVVTTTTPKAMPVTRLSDENGTQLPSVAIEPSIVPNVQFFPNPSDPRSLTDTGWMLRDAAGKGDYYTAIVRPRNFDPKKKYPVVVDVYGGPTHLHVVQAMRNWLVPQWLADQGFIVVAVDNRGTPGRGRDWEKAVYQKFGTVPLEDQVKGLHALCDKFPELDRERVGMVGWSFGGYMAANGVLRRPDVFKAAVAGAPVTDWEDYDTHYTERYMGLLPESKAAYDEASLIPLAPKLSRPLLLVHGTADDNVYYRHSLKLADALFRAGRPFEALPLPGVTHMYSADPVVMERLWAKTAGFFKTHLGEPK